MNLLKKKEEKSQELKELEERRASFQELLPIKDVENGCLIDDNGYKHPVLSLGTVNIELYSNDMKESLIRQLESVLGSLNFSEYQILVLPMPFNIDTWRRYNNNLYEEIQEQCNKYSEQTQEGRLLRARLQLLKNQINYVTAKLQSGGMNTRKVYFIPKIDSTDDIRVAVEQGKEVASRFMSMNIECSLSSESELRQMLYVLHNPLSSSIANVPRQSVSPILRD